MTSKAVLEHQIREKLADIEQRYQAGEQLRQQINRSVATLIAFDQALRETDRTLPILQTVIETAKERREVAPRDVSELTESAYALVHTVAPDIASRPR